MIARLLYSGEITSKEGDRYSRGCLLGVVTIQLIPMHSVQTMRVWGTITIYYLLSTGLYLSLLSLTICWVSLIKIMSNANAAASSSQTIPENLLEAFLDATPNYKPCSLTNLAPFP